MQKEAREYENSKLFTLLQTLLLFALALQTLGET